MLHLQKERIRSTGLKVLHLESLNDSICFNLCFICTMRHIAISGSFNASEWSDSVGMSWVDCWMTRFHILEGEIGGGKKVRMKNHLFGSRTAPHLLLKHAKARKTHEKHQLPTTSFYDKTLFEPALPRLAGGLPCHLPAVGTGRKHNPEDCRSLG